MKKVFKIFKSIGQGVIKFLKLLWGVVERLTEKEVILGLILLLVLGLFVVYLSLSMGENYKGLHLKNILIEAHGLIFDIFVFGVIVIIFNKIAERRRNIRRWKEEIDDFRGWDEKEAMHRIVGKIRRLNEQKISEIDLRNCFLKNSNLMDANLKRAKLGGADFDYAELERVNLNEAVLYGTSLEGANLYKANLDGAYLYKANLQEASLEEASLKGAYLKSTDLRDAQITVDQLSTVMSLFRTKLDPLIESEINKRFPHLLKEPKPEEHEN